MPVPPRWWSPRQLLLLCAVFLLSGALFLSVCVVLVLAQGSIEDKTDIFSWINGFKLGRERLSGMARSSATGIVIGGTDVASITTMTGTVSRTMTANGMQGVLPAIQTLAAGGVVASDGCGGLKRITSAGAVTTDTTNSIADPTAVPGCIMIITNVGAQTITLDKNALILLVGGADVPLLANSSIMVASDGVVWRQIAAQLTAT
jgi:hypothetical protein